MSRSCMFCSEWGSCCCMQRLLTHPASSLRNVVRTYMRCAQPLYYVRFVGVSGCSVVGHSRPYRSDAVLCPAQIRSVRCCRIWRSYGRRETTVVKESRQQETVLLRNPRKVSYFFSEVCVSAALATDLATDLATGFVPTCQHSSSQHPPPPPHRYWPP